MQTTTEEKKLDGLDIIRLVSAEFNRRSTLNDQYSLRAFARDIGMDSGYLSRLMSGKRIPKGKTLEKIIQALKIDLGEYQSSLQNNFSSVDLESFNVISDWHHYAILELTRVKSFQSDEAWIASKLGLKESVAKEAIERLFAIGMLKEDEEGNWKDVSGYVSTVNFPYTNKALKNHQKQVLKKAQSAIDEVEFERRSHSSLTFTYTPDQISRLKKMIREFESEVMKEAKANKEKINVYNMSIALYPVTELEGENRNER